MFGSRWALTLSEVLVRSRAPRNRPGSPRLSRAPREGRGRGCCRYKLGIVSGVKWQDLNKLAKRLWTVAIVPR